MVCTDHAPDIKTYDKGYSFFCFLFGHRQKNFSSGTIIKQFEAKSGASTKMRLKISNIFIKVG